MNNSSEELKEAGMIILELINLINNINGISQQNPYSAEELYPDLFMRAKFILDKAFSNETAMY